MDGTLSFANFNWGRILNSNNATRNLCKTFRKYLFRHVKVKCMVNFYIVNALGHNFENSESCPILRLLEEAKVCNFM